jgi:UDP-2,3-diacylglucosamine pyrophosphatase LpxH
VETVVVSDMHLSEAQQPDPRRPLWMAYKRREFFIDDDFARLLGFIERQAEGPIELVLNGDTFDFDNVTQLPAKPAGRVDWLARLRGLASEEWMSLHKIECIIRDHPIWFEALAAFVRHGHRAVFVMGNHDVELGWPSVQQRIREALALPASSVPPLPSPEQWAAWAGAGSPPAASAARGADEPGPDSLRPLEPVVFCAWFYLSEGDTFVSHGSQYDRNCVAKSPVNPLILVRGRPQIRIPFGDLAGRYLLNGMGYFNPHAAENYIMSAGQYLRFFFRYMLTTQPLLAWSWLWGAVVTFLIALRSHWRPAMRDPLLVDEKVQAIAWRSNATPSMVRKLNELSLPSAASNPFAILRELWLDRALLLLASLYGAWQLVLLVNIALPVSPLWGLVPLAIFLPIFAAYAASVNPTVFRHPLLTPKRAELIIKITGAKRVVFGHTHRPEHCEVGPVSYFNQGFWSPAFTEPECTHRMGTQTFVRIRPMPTGPDRVAELCEWPPGASEPRPFEPPRGSGACAEPTEEPPESSG